MFGAKLSWCQIVRCQIVLVPNCLGAKLSTFIILVPNCLLLLSWCQIVRFIILVPNCPVPNCLVPNCPTIQLYNCANVQLCKRTIVQFCICAIVQTYDVLCNRVYCCTNAQRCKCAQVYQHNTAAREVCIFSHVYA